MGHVGLAGSALLTTVELLGEPIGAVQDLQVGAWLVLRNFLQQRLESGHRALTLD
jgi:hypothetical protein